MPSPQIAPTVAAISRSSQRKFASWNVEPTPAINDPSIVSTMPAPMALRAPATFNPATSSSLVMGVNAATTSKSGVLSFPGELARRLGEGNVLRSKGVGILGGTDEGIAAAVAAAKRADLVILTLGESPDMSGEAASRSNLGLPGRQQELLEAIVNTGKPVVLILFSGRPLTVPWAFEHVPTVLAAWFPGTETGPALARTLFGESNPSGKLVVSWPRSVGQEPLYYNALSTGRPAGSQLKDALSRLRVFRPVSREIVDLIQDLAKKD